MFKRALALLLTACMMFDSSAITALAAEPQTEVVSEVETETTETEETEEVSEAVLVEEETGSELLAEETVTESEVVTEEVVTETEEMTETEEIVIETVVTEKTDVQEDIIPVEETEYPALSVGVTTAVTIPAYVPDTEYVVYTFTAPETGVYTLNAKTPDSYDSSYINVYTDEEFDASISYGSAYMYSDANLILPEMQAGESIYIRMHTYSGSDVEASVTIKKLPTYTLVEQEDDSYTAETEDYIFRTSVKAGYQSLRGEVSLTAKEGAVLANNYYVKNMAETIDGTYKSTYSNTTYLYSYSDYTGIASVQVEQGSKYNVYYILQDYDTDEYLAMFAGDMLLTTGKTDQNYHLYDITAKETSVIFELEVFGYSNKCYYAPTDGSEDETYMVFNSGWQDLQVYNLQPGTEYYFEFLDNDSNLLGREIVSTKETTAVFEYDAAFLEDGTTLKFSVDVSNYNGDDNYAYLYYKYTDELGYEHTGNSYKYISNLEVDPETGKEFRISTSVSPAFIAGETYDIELWVEFDDVTYSKTIKTITIPETAVEADDILFTIEAREEVEGYVDYSVDIANVEDEIYGMLYYRLQGDVTYNSQAVWVFPNNKEGYVSGLQTGSTYEFVLIICGRRIDALVTVGDAVLQLIPVAESAEDNAFDIVREFKVESTGELENVYYLKMYYMTEGDTSWKELGYYSYVELNAANGYQAKYKTADFRGLFPDTEYKIKWLLTTDEYSSNGYSIFETITTKEPDLTIEETKSFINSQQYCLTLNTECISNFDDFFAIVNAYVRETGKNTYRELGETHFDSDYDYISTLQIDGLKPNTQYDLSLRLQIGDEHAEYKTFTFTTPVDARKVVIEEPIKTYLDLVEISYTVEGMDVVDETSVRLFVKEQGETEWINPTSWSYDSEESTDYEGIKKFTWANINGAGFEENTTFDYKIGFGKYDTTVNNLEKAVTGTFTIPKDTRTVTMNEPEANFHNVTLPYTLSGMEVIADDTCVLIYIREKGTEGAWEKADYSNYSNGDSLTSYFYVRRYNGAELKEDQEYEYEVGFGDYNESRETLAQKLTGTFKTAEDPRRANVTVTPNYTRATMNVSFTGNNFNKFTCVHYFYRLKDAAEWIYIGTLGGTYEVSGSRTATINNLNVGTEYEYVAIVSDSNSYGNPDEITDERRKASGSFTTKKNTYELEFELNESKLTYESAVVAVTATGGTDSSVNVLLTLSNGNDVVSQETVSLKAGNDYTKEVTFEDLLGSTEYTISAAQFSVSENGNTIDLGTKEFAFKFTTKEAIPPTAITLNASEMLLNCISGYNMGKLSVAVEPTTAADAVVWESSNPAVATVREDGWVIGQSVGTAIITATSRYCDADGKYASASCEVTVKKYVVGCAGEEEPTLYENFTTLAISKNGQNKSMEGLGFYEVDINGKATLMEEYDVTVEKNGIVDWDKESGTLSATGLGYTYVVFEKDGIKAAVYVETFLEATGFSITGFETSNNSIPAILNADGSYTFGWLNGTTYTAKGMLSPVGEFNPADFNWTIADTSIATVDEQTGVITICGGGKTTLTVSPRNTNTSRAYVKQEQVITFETKGLPFSEFATTYAIVNVDKKLSDIEFDFSDQIKALAAERGMSEEALQEALDGWSWKNPKTPLVTNGHNRESYDFEVVYEGANSYPLEARVEVYIGKINGVSVYETNGSHKQMLLTSTAESVKDSITLNVSAYGEGIINAADYTIEMPDVKNLTIVRNGSNFTITALKAGAYTLTPVIKVGNKVVAKGSYKITAVDTPQVDNIGLTATMNGEHIDIVNNKIIFDTTDEDKNFELQAIVTALGEAAATKLNWSSSDKSVIDVKADAANSHIAKVTAKGEGHAVITVTANDKLKYKVTLNVEIQNHAPRVNKNKVTVNTAYDYNSSYGKSLAAAAGVVEIVPVYDSAITSVQLYDKTGTSVSTDLRIQQYSYNSTYEWLVMPINADLKKGTYDCTLRVTTSAGVTKDYPLKVTVNNKKLSVKASMSTKVNLFYTNATGDIKITGTKGAAVSSISWVPVDGTNSGFSISRYGNYSSYYRLGVSQNAGIDVVKGALKNKDVAKGTLTVKVNGYRDTFTFKNFSIKTIYKKPSLVTTGSVVVPTLGQVSNGFSIYDKTNKITLSYNTTNTNSIYYYNELSYDNDAVDVNVEQGSYWVSYTFNGIKNTKLNMVVDAEIWRESLKVTHSITVKKPKVVLGGTTVTFNTVATRENTVYRNVYLDNGMRVNFSDITIQGTDAKSKDLMAKDLFVLSTEGNSIKVAQKDAVTLGQTAVKAGTYKYKLTPYYTNEDGEKTALNAVTLSVKVMTKSVTAKVSAKGSIDLSNGTNYNVSKKTNAVWVDPKFSNAPEGFYVNEYKVVGEYSNYFRMGQSGGHYFVTVSSEGLNKLRSGQSYKLAVEYTMVNSYGDTYTVTSNTFSVKPKQSKPKITISGNNQTLYAAAGSVSRMYDISLPNYYTISNIYGSLDCNKDGVTDIVVTPNSIYGSYSNYAELAVRLSDCDGAVSAKNGKTYTVPVTVQLVGRDGVAKDVTVNLKVTVKR